MTKNDNVGFVFLPPYPGSAVGEVKTIIEDSSNTDVKVGAFLTTDTDECSTVSTITGLSLSGSMSSPREAYLSTLGGPSVVPHAKPVLVAESKVLSGSEGRPVGEGRVRLSSKGEVYDALGQDNISWPIPLGCVELPGGMMPICGDGEFINGPESQGVLVAGKSGLASKTSYMTFLLRGLVASDPEKYRSVAVLAFNVKGADLTFLDEDTEGDLTEEDLAIYEACGVPAEPFPDVEVWAPSLPHGAGVNSRRGDARAIQWDLHHIWPYLDTLFPVAMADEKMAALIADIGNEVISSGGRGNGVSTMSELKDWFKDRLDTAQVEKKSEFYRQHHIATGRRCLKLLGSIQNRLSGLFTDHKVNGDKDVPTTGWRHGMVRTVDVSALSDDVKAILVGRTVSRVMKAAENDQLGVDCVVVVVDELNKWAPDQGSGGGVKSVCQLVASQGRYAGVSLWGAGQKLSKVDDLVRENSSTMAIGLSDGEELRTGAYGHLPAGLIQQAETMKKGQMLLRHYMFRDRVLVRFPRPAWFTGKKDDAQNPNIVDVADVADGAVDITSGLTAEEIDDIIAGSDNAEDARSKLAQASTPDPTRGGKVATPGLDDNIFGF